MSLHPNPYTRANPFIATIKERYSLCHPCSKKVTQHLVVDLGDIPFPYSVGDSIGIYSHNDPELVEKNLKAMKLTGEENIILRQTNQASSFHEFLTKKASVTEFSRKLLNDIKDRQTNPEKKQMLEKLFDDSQALKHYIAEHEVWDLLEEHAEVTFTAQEYADHLMPNLPRLYSIASSPVAHPKEIHLTVALTAYTTNGHQRYGVCTHYLCHIAKIGDKIPIYLQPHKGFTLPTNFSAPIIMIGPGTGVAPFRAFMQERIATKASGKNWLFFGEWTEKGEFFYEDFWKDLVMTHQLRLDTAFSRDQETKVYVQHRMMEKAHDLYAWLEEGAYLYVCGDADQMAKDVEATLIEIIKQESGRSPEEAKLYLKNMRMQKRYLKDVY